MDPKNWPLALGVVTALLLLLSRGAAAPDRSRKVEEPAAKTAEQENPAPAPAPAAPETTCNRWCEPIRLYEEFFGLPPGGSLEPVLTAAKDRRYKLDVLIALIPDPVDSGMSYRSDEVLSAIQRGFVDSEYRFDRQWLPWVGDPAKARRFEREPGALLFRRSSPRFQMLTLVLLIGETPKGGLRKGPFREALGLAGRVRAFARPSESPVKILGPTFSGTTESLRIALLGWLEESLRLGPPEVPFGPVRIVTGSATTPGLEEIFAEHLEGQVIFERTIVQDDELEAAAYRYLEEELGWDFRRVALLIEADTAYGQGALMRARRVALWEVNLLALALLFAVLVLGCALLPWAEPRPSFGLPGALAWILGAALLLVLLDGLLWHLWLLPQGRELFYARAGDFASGLSPLVSLACLLAAVFTSALLAVRRRRTSLIQGVKWPLDPALGKGPLAVSGEMARGLDEILDLWFPGRWFWAGVGVALLLSLRRLWSIQPIAERPGYGWVFLALVGLASLLGAITFYRFVLVWRKLECILDLLCHTWLHGAVGRNSGFVEWKPLRSFGWRMPRHRMSLLSAQVLRSLMRKGVRGADGAPLGVITDLDEKVREVIEKEKNHDLKAEVCARWVLQGWFEQSAGRLEEVRRQMPAGDKELLEEVEKFLSVRVIGWLRYVFGHLRYSLISALACGLFVLVGVSAYAFQPKRFLSFVIWSLLLTASLLTLRIFLRMDRNAMLSAIGGSDAGKVSFDRTFFANLFTYAGLPVLGVLFTQFPAAGSLLGEWLQPLLRLLSTS